MATSQPAILARESLSGTAELPLNLIMVNRRLSCESMMFNDSAISGWEVLSPPASAVIHSRMDVARRRDNQSTIRYSNGPLPQGALSSLTSSPISPILTAWSSSLSMRSTELGSPSLAPDHADNKDDLFDIRLNLVCNWLRQKQLQSLWSTGDLGEGVFLRKAKDQYLCCPTELTSHPGKILDYIKQLDVKCALTVNTKTTRMLLTVDASSSISLDDGLQIQFLDDLNQHFETQKNQCALFLREPPLLVVWDDDPTHIIDRVHDLETHMMKYIMKGPDNPEKQEPQAYLQTSFAHRYSGVDVLDSNLSHHRKTVLIQPLIIAITLMIMCIALAAGWRSVALEIKISKRWICILLPCIGPIQAWMGLFFFQTLPTCLAQVFGPVRQMKQNSKSYSGRAPLRLSGTDLPHVTVQCPVYKESLHTVIEPTIRSIQAAISTYEKQGGSANIFINDDGLQLIPDDQAQQRRDFYEKHNIGWVARPKHNSTPSSREKYFVREGKFKKASNMNYGLNVSLRVEAELQAMERSDRWTAEDELAAYDKALAKVVNEDQGLTLAAGNIRIGDYILLIDSDTRVPPDCLHDAVSEMEQSPEVAILQYSSGVMNVTESWFEQGITFFTRLVYTAIEFAVANGDVAPFVGHNACLRWSAVQDVAFSTPDRPCYQTFWSENTVSEDFDMALRLQTSGYILRLAAYTNGGFKEGVSLTVYDELARWEKYAYGCSELIFNPLAQWIFKGPTTPLFRRFIFSSMPLHSKISILAYVGTYFAIASSWLLTVLNYFLIGWYNGYLDHYYIDSFKIYFSTIVIFNLVGNIALAILRYRINEKGLLSSLFENFKWVIFLTTFLGGISLHVSQAILCHLFSIDMSWGATSKEASDTSFFREIPIILRKFRFTFTFCLTLTVTMIVLAGIGPFGDVVPHEWQITKFTAIFPLGMMLACHTLLPLALNPGLMKFTF